jgi:membrane protease YdiL (CAAX protease family)
MTAAMIEHAPARRFPWTGAAALLAFAAAWSASVNYLRVHGAEWSFPPIAMGVFGLVLPALVWALTRRSAPPMPEVRRPGLESAAMAGFLALYAIGFLGWGLGALREAIPAGQAREAAILASKLTVHVLMPAALLALLGVRVSALFSARLGAKGVAATLVAVATILLGLLAVVTPSLRNLAELHPTAATLAWAAPASFVWIALEAGLCEEFLFRACLQTRLEALLRSPLAAVLATSTVFALAHAPGLFLRGGPGVDGWSTDPVQVIAFTIATLSPVSLLFGVLWVRTRSLLLCVLLHAAIDFLPNLVDFYRLWT